MEVESLSGVRNVNFWASKKGGKVYQFLGYSLMGWFRNLHLNMVVSSQIKHIESHQSYIEAVITDIITQFNEVILNHNSVIETIFDE